MTSRVQSGLSCRSTARWGRAERTREGLGTAPSKCRWAELRGCVDQCGARRRLPVAAVSSWRGGDFQSPFVAPPTGQLAPRMQRPSSSMRGARPTSAHSSPLTAQLMPSLGREVPSLERDGTSKSRSGPSLGRSAPSTVAYAPFAPPRLQSIRQKAPENRPTRPSLTSQAREVYTRTHKPSLL